MYMATKAPALAVLLVLALGFAADLSLGQSASLLHGFPSFLGKSRFAVGAVSFLQYTNFGSIVRLSWKWVSSKQRRDCSHLHAQLLL
jgi:hypothetical protein